MWIELTCLSSFECFLAGAAIVASIAWEEKHRAKQQHLYTKQISYKKRTALRMKRVRFENLNHVDIRNGAELPAAGSLPPDCQQIWGPFLPNEWSYRVQTP